ncbi:hypothetical protein QWZ13_13170 [Reinekea marina]|uniref:hypothetical protein n=1 Tax=Reinekea marina TaxID=1310421 RepID=UPI0025B33C96|nr:hypothetical protein [Reinekea marina]MDN3649864.1 hypothetical protein [Reinekea marina]
MFRKRLYRLTNFLSLIRDGENRAFIGMGANDEPPWMGLRRPFFHHLGLGDSCHLFKITRNSNVDRLVSKLTLKWDVAKSSPDKRQKSRYFTALLVDLGGGLQYCSHS